MSVGFGDPAALLGVAGEGFSVDALGGEDRQGAGFGTIAGAMLADVGVAAGALGGCAEAEPAGHPRLQQRGVLPVRPPVMSVSGRVTRPVAGVRACCLARSSARSYSARTVVSNSRP